MAEPRLDGLVYGHFGDGCVHARIDFPFSDPRRRASASSSSPRRSWSARYGGSMSGEHGDGRARGELLPYMYSPAAIDAFGRGQGASSTPATCSTRACSSTRRRSTPTCGVPLARPLRAGLGFAYPHDDGDLSAAVHRCVGVGKCRADTTAAGGVMCPSYLATRDEKDSTRGRARVLQELANGALVRGLRAPPRSPRRSTCACPARGARRTARPASTWPPTRPRCSTSATGTGCARRRTTRWAGCRAGPPWPPARRGLANAMLRRRPARRPGQAAGRHRPAPPAAQVRPAHVSANGSRQRPVATRATPVLLWVDTFTDHFTPEVGRAAVRGAARPPAMRSRSPPSRSAAG